jgi:hypothetical protein
MVSIALNRMPFLPFRSASADLVAADFGKTIHYSFVDSIKLAGWQPWDDETHQWINGKSTFSV